jgi:hypothetical protein
MDTWSWCPSGVSDECSCLSIPSSRSPQHRIHTIHRLPEMLGCEMRIAHGHTQVFMAQKLLNRLQIEAFHREM